MAIISQTVWITPIRAALTDDDYANAKAVGATMIEMLPGTPEPGRVEGRNIEENPPYIPQDIKLDMPDLPLIEIGLENVSRGYGFLDIKQNTLLRLRTVPELGQELHFGIRNTSRATRTVAFGLGFHSSVAPIQIPDNTLRLVYFDSFGRIFFKIMDQSISLV